MSYKLRIIQHSQELIIFLVIVLDSLFSLFEIVSQTPHILFPFDDELNQMNC